MRKLTLFIATLLMTVAKTVAFEVSTTVGNPEHQYFITNGNGIKMAANTAPTQNNRGLFAFFAAGDNAYKIYSVDKQQWVSYDKTSTTDNIKNFATFVDAQDDANAWQITSTSANNGYNVQPFNNDGTVGARYWNWNGGVGEGGGYGYQYDDTKTVGLWKQDATADAGSRWVFSQDVNYTLTDALGNTYTGTSEVIDGETLVLPGGAGCTFTGETLNGNNYTATINFPFPVSKEGGVTNMTTIASVNDAKKWCATDDAVIMVQTSGYDANDNDWLWAIYPQFDNGAFSFKIKSIGKDKYIYTNATGSKVDTGNNDDDAGNAAGAVSLTDEGTAFAVVKSNSVVGFHYTADGKNQYLSINSKNDTKVYLGVHNAIHTGTDCHFSLIKTVGPTVAKIGDEHYETLAEAVAAAQSGDVITLLAGCDETVSINKSNVAFTIDGAQQTYTGKVQINIGQNVTIKNVNFVHSGDEAHDFIANVGSPTGKNYNTTLLVENCSFTGNGQENVVAVRTIHPTSVTIKNCTATGLHSFLQNTGGQVVTIDGVTLTDSKGGLAIGSPNGAVSVKNCDLTTATYGVRLDANNTIAPGATLENNKVTAYIPVSVRKAEAPAYNLTFNGDASAYTATNSDNVWCAVCKDEYEEGVALNDPTGKINVTLNAANLDATGVYGEYVPAAKIGDTEYDTLNEAFTAATEGQTITMLDDATPVLKSQRAITKAAVIDLGGKTLTLTEDDLYFGTTTFKNGTIVVDPSVKASTAVFWMFANQTLTFDNVDIIATGVTGTYLIGINGGTGTAVYLLNGSSITMENESTTALTAVICDNGTGNTVTIDNSTIAVSNIEGRFYLGGSDGTVSVENTSVELNGVKEGFYLRAGQSLDIAGTSTVDITLNDTNGRYGINLTDATAKYTQAADATVNATIFEKKAGRDFNGYTGENRIWGETWGNAKESFVIKVLDANGNVMGTTSLNNVGGIINGDVTVTWNLLFDAASNDDEYWTMEWTTAPSISNMPAKVALWVDGVEVSGGDVVLNAPDDLNKIVAAVTDAEGKILSCHTSLAGAVETNATYIALLRETDEEVELPFDVTLDRNGFVADNVTETLPVAKIGDDAYFGTLQAALDAATDGQTVTLLTGITLTDADMVKIEGKYNVMMNVSGKDITLNLNEQTINIDYNGGQYLYAAVFVADGAGLTVTGNGKIDIAENGINVAYMFWKRGTTGHLTIENGTFHMDDSADSMVYTNGSEIVTVNGGTFTLDAVGTRENGFPCVFSAYGQNTANIIVNGGTYNYDVNHQYWAHEVNVPETLALNDNGDGTWTVVPAVAYAVEKSSSYNRHVGYTTLEEAIAAAETVVLLSDIETTDGYAIANGKKLTLDLNGKTIAATDNTSKNYGAIDNRGDLTITDSSEEQTGKITLTATVNSGWGRYSAVISNNPGGKLTVESGTLEHLGGTDMAYGIDNLTNGKGTYAETIINGGVVKSPYRGIRQFLNGVEAQNILTVNGGTIEGANKSIWMQDPSKNANTGTLTVGENAKLNGDVYLFVTAGSTEWPVEVSIAAAALQGESKVVTGNVPANWTVSNVNGTWGKVAAVATTNGVGYTSVTEAINAAEDGGVVEIFAGTISEYIAPWAGNSKHDTEKSITIQGAADFGTVLTGGMYLGYDDSQCREHNITVKGIHFTGKGLTVACQQNVAIEDNKFTDIEGRAIAVIGKNINSVVKNNVIENTTSVGIELRNTLTATVEDNTITGTGHNALQITSQVGATESTATVKNNMMSDWGVGGEGRAMRFEGIVTATVNGNVMSHTAAPEEFAKIINSATLDASQNYWNGVSPLTAGIFTGVEGDPAVVLKSYYTDAEKTNLVEFSAAGSAARIGSVYFATLAEAIAAAEANDVITFLTDIDESVTITKSVTIDGGDKQYTGTMTINTSLNVTVQNVNFVKGCITEANGSHGYLTVKDCDFDGVDKSIGYAITVDGCDNVTIENSTANDYSTGMLYMKSGNTVNVKDVTVENVAAAFNVSRSNDGTFENVTLNNVTYGLHVQNWGARTFTLTNWNVTGSEYPIYVQEKSTANVTFAFEGTNEMGVEQLSSSQYAIYKNASMVGTTVYGDLNDAAAAAAANGTVTLLGNMAIESDLNNAAKGLVNIAADAQVTIDLNGKTIDVTDKSAGNFIVFYNYGDLTIKNGTVNLVAENNREWNAQSTIILNRGGNLTVESGTYTHQGGTDMAFALDNSGNSFGDASMTIVDGTVESAYIAIRNRMADTALNDNPGNGIAELNVQGGYIKGVKIGIWGQITNASSDFLGSLTVTGGTIEGAVAIQMAEDSYENITVAISDDAVIKGDLAGDAVDYNVTGGTFYNEIAEDYLAWGYQLVGDAAPYTVEYTGKVSELTIVDGELDEFVNEQEVTVGTLTYERTMPAAGNWYPLYVPFKIPVETLTALGYEVAYLYDVHSKVINDYEVNPSKIESIHLVKISTGTLRANYPYVIRATETADLKLVLEFSDATLFSTKEMNSVESSTTTTRYIFAGTYTKTDRATLTGDADTPCYAVYSDGKWYPMDATETLGAFRVFMYIVSKDGSPVIVGDEAAQSIQMRVIGEENEDGTTFIYDVEMDGEQTVDYIYDLQGRRVLEPQKGSLYIVNGKKVVF